MSLKTIIKSILQVCGVKPADAIQRISAWSIRRSLAQQRLDRLVPRLREIEPDLSRQELTEQDVYNEYWELKRRGLQSFQCGLMLEALKQLPDRKLTVVDIGDSAGTHMLYLTELARQTHQLETIGVNLDPGAIEKIRARGQRAILCRAEDLDLGEQSVDLFTSFQMVEHLHNPSIFFRRLAKKSACTTMLLTVPYLKNSRVGLHTVRNRSVRPVVAEEEHIFELSPQDWELLLLHSGWRITASTIYYQYPCGIPLVSRLLGWFWRQTDYEGFWGAILTKDLTYSDQYQDWGE